MIPEYDAVVIDEAHEVVSRVTQAATDEMSVSEVERAARRSQRYVEGSEADDLADAADALADAVAASSPGRFDTMPEQLGDALVLVRDAARKCLSAYPKDSDASEVDAGRTQARGSVQEVFVNAERMAADAESDVLWLAEGGDRFPPRLCVAPLEVWGPMRDKLLTDKTVVFTSATLMLGGDFSAVATSVGLKPRARGRRRDGLDEPTTVATRRAAVAWNRRRVAVRLRPAGDPLHRAPPAAARPRRPGRGHAEGDRRAGRRRRGPHPRAVLVAPGRRDRGRGGPRAAAPPDHARPGRRPAPELAKQFVEDPHTCLFGTLSLWQGLDVPGDTCQLVIIDRIPFPRPDDPLMSARQRAVEKAGGNGFMQVAATHAALLLAQGSGRLIRTTTDRGIVAVLDPRLATARYGSFLKASLPPMWTTTDPAVVRKALARIAAG